MKIMLRFFNRAATAFEEFVGVESCLTAQHESEESRHDANRFAMAQVFPQTNQQQAIFKTCEISH